MLPDSKPFDIFKRLLEPRNRPRHPEPTDEHESRRGFRKALRAFASDAFVAFSAKGSESMNPEGSKQTAAPTPGQAPNALNPDPSSRTSLLVQTAAPTPEQAPNTRNPSPSSHTSPLVQVDSSGSLWGGLKRFAGALQDCGIEFGPLKSAIEGFVACAEIFQVSGEMQEEYDSLRKILDWHFHDLAEQFGDETPPSIQPSIINLASGLQREIDYVRLKQQGGGSQGYAQAQADIEDVMRSYRRIQSLVDRLLLNANVNIWLGLEGVATRLNLDRLSPSHAAYYNSHEAKQINRDECTPDTRLQVLERFRAWRNDRSGEKIYWLNGMAGTGKTTVTFTLCKELEAEKRLAANFFCSRRLPTCSETRFILPTIAYQLAQFSYPFKCVLSQVLDQHPDVHTREIKMQFQDLLLDPLKEIKDSVPEDLLVVIEGLDECNDASSVGDILDLLLENVKDLPVRFFLTSRPEPDIRRRMCNRGGDRERSELHLHDISRSIVQDDIHKFLAAGLSHTNVSTSDLAILVERSDGLFIYAATIVRYVSDGGPGRTQQRLKLVLNAAPAATGPDAAINALYTLILEHAIRNLEEHEQHEMLVIVHTVICAQEPLTAYTISVALGLEGAEVVLVAIDPLRSVLNIQHDDEVITTLHKSFSDYLFDESRSNQFWCDAAKHNAKVALGLMRVIQAVDPPFNICHLPSSYVLDKDVPNLSETIKECISERLVYACRTWGTYVQRAEPAQGLSASVEKVLSSRLLLCTEVLNLTGNLRDSEAGSLKGLCEWTKRLPKSQQAELIHELAVDACQFIEAFASGDATQSTPHIYVSVLRLWPAGRPVSRCYSQHIQPTSSVVSKSSGMAYTADAGKSKSSASSIWSTSSELCAVTMAPAGQMIAACDRDGLISIWDIESRNLIASPMNSGGQPSTCVALSPDGKRLACGFDDCTIRIWNSLTQIEARNPLRGHTSAVWCVGYSPDGAHIASGSADCTIRIWSSSGGTKAKVVLEGHTGGVNSIVYSPSGKHVVSGSDDRTVRIWSISKKKTRVDPLKGHSGRVRTVTYSPDGQRVASGAEDYTIRIWDPQNGRQVGEPLEGHASIVHCVLYSSDSRLIVSGSYDRTVRVWDAGSGQTVAGPFTGHTSWVCSAAFMAGSARVVSCSSDGTIREWDLEDVYARASRSDEHTGWMTSVAFSPDSSCIVSGGEDGAVRVWDVGAGTMRYNALTGHTSTVLSVAYSPCGGYIASGSNDYTIRIWDARTGQLRGQPLNGHTSGVNSVAFSPDGSRLASGSGDRTIQVWDVQSGSVVAGPFTGLTHWIRSVAYSPDGTRIVSCSIDKTVRVWDAQTGATVAGPFSCSSSSVMYSSDGTRILCTSGHDVVVLDALTGQVVTGPCTGHTDLARSAVFSSDNRHIISGSRDRTICVWDAQTGHLVNGPFHAHTNLVTSLACSPDGRLVASCSGDGTIRIWDSHMLTSPPPPDNSWWTVNKDGWVVGHDSRLLVWVPPALLRTGLKWPQYVTLIPEPSQWQLDLTETHLGTEWANCYVDA